MKRRICILGSTGSIGVNALEVINTFKELFEVDSLTVNSNIDLLEKQINEFDPKSVVVKNNKKADLLKTRIGNKCEVLSGEEGLIKLTKNNDYDILVSSLVGFAGLAPTIEGIKRKKRIALANKETLVVAGQLIMKLCKEYSAELIPVDSEHSAIYQCLIGEDKKNIRKLILTASGGPFFKRKNLEDITIEEALNHPNWKMGNKITIDSATMMNKGLEVIEAHWLFGLPNEKIDVIIHPQSIIHSMVEFNDRSIKAQLSIPDMKLPIQYALSFPDRLESNFIETDFPSISELTFFSPDKSKFKCLNLAYEVMEHGGTSPCILNAANEVAVDKFLKGEIEFKMIPGIIEKALNNIENNSEPDLDTIFDCDFKTREYVKKIYN
ncbi:MAG: 1-deoxy-D-xylulose-5-phosphate reductoisomerase [Ignavibacteria bacterium]